MSSKRRRQSAKVYRRRRILVGLLAALVLVLIGWMAASLIGGDDTAADPAAEEESPPSGSDPAEPESTDSDPADSEDGDSEDADAPDGEDEAAAEAEAQNEPPKDGYCRTGDLQVSASTGSESYGSGFAPMLVMEVQNNAEYACSADLGTAEQEFLVEHAGATVFSTAECSVSRESLEVELEPGQSEEARFTWPRSDSSEDCTAPTALEPGAYELTVSLGGVRSEPHEFTLSDG